MRPNRLRQIWADDKAAINGWLAIPSSFSAEVMAHQGWDSLTIDLQHGVICPMINTREDAQKLVHYTHYAPLGTRSFGPIRASLYGGADYPEHANKTIVTFAMIETAQALDNLDAILSVEGLDAIYIGPSDLSLSLGCKPVFDDVEPKAQQAIEHIVARAKAHGVVAGIHNGRADVATARVGLGFRFVTLGSDARLLAAGSQELLAAMRG